MEILYARPIESNGLVLEPSHRIALQHSSVLSHVSRVYTINRFSYILTSHLGNVNIIKMSHDIGTRPLIRSFPIKAIRQKPASLEFGLVLLLKSDFSMDFITYDLDREADDIESQVHVGPFAGVHHLKILACDEASGRLVLLRGGREYMLLCLR